MAAVAAPSSLRAVPLVPGQAGAESGEHREAVGQLQALRREREAAALGRAGTSVGSSRHSPPRPPEVSLDAACLPAALLLLRVTTAVLHLGERLAAGDVSAADEVRELAERLG